MFRDIHTNQLNFDTGAGGGADSRRSNGVFLAFWGIIGKKWRGVVL